MNDLITREIKAFTAYHHARMSEGKAVVDELDANIERTRAQMNTGTTGLNNMGHLMHLAFGEYLVQTRDLDTDVVRILQVCI